MNILFNALGCGLGNNGGTNTIVKCADELRRQGHNVQIVGVNRYTWGPVDGVLNHMPRVSYGAEIIVSVWDTPITDAPRKVWWVRGYEQWVNGEEYFLQRVREFPGEVWANSTWLANTLSIVCERDVRLQFAGMDFGTWNIHRGRSWCTDAGLRVGCMPYARHASKRTDMIDRLIVELSGRANPVAVESGFDAAEMAEEYNECDFWFAPTELEGFHNPAAEACLCGATVLMQNAPRNGMWDYTPTDYPFYFKTVEEAVEKIRGASMYERAKAQHGMEECLRVNVGSREQRMKEFTDALMA